MKVGEHWGYGTSDAPLWFNEVEVKRIDGNQVVVTFFDDDGVESKLYRKPARNLRVLWDDSWEFLQEARIRQADEHAEFDAVDCVFEWFISWDIARTVGRRSNDVEIRNPRAFSEITGISLVVVQSGEADCYQSARFTAERNADRLLQIVDNEERSELYAALQNAMNEAYDWPYLDLSDSKDRLAEEAGRRTRKRNSVLRTWAGQPAIDRARENTQLRRELLRTQMIAIQAIRALSGAARTKGVERLAIALDDELKSMDAKPD
jgi:hypothetical protein